MGEDSDKLSAAAAARSNSSHKPRAHERPCCSVLAAAPHKSHADQGQVRPYDAHQEPLYLRSCLLLLSVRSALLAAPSPCQSCFLFRAPLVCLLLPFTPACTICIPYILFSCWWRICCYFPLLFLHLSFTSMWTVIAIFPFSCAVVGYSLVSAAFSVLAAAHTYEIPPSDLSLQLSAAPRRRILFARHEKCSR